MCYNGYILGGTMYLISFDIIESRKHALQLTEVFTNQVVSEYHQKYQIDSGLIEIYGGDQFRLLADNSALIIELVIETFTRLYDYQMQARCFITVGEINNSANQISSATGEIFYQNRQLEADVKATKNPKSNTIYYRGLDKSDEISLLFSTFNKLVLNKPGYLKALYNYHFCGRSQVEVARLIGISQSTVNNQLNKVNSELISSYNQVISKLIEEELCKVEN